MAGRRNRKKLINIGSNYKWKAGIYCRLSSDDGDNAESDSIINQKGIITNYIKTENEISIVDYYIDDGYSGTSFSRPGFKRLFADITSGKINTIIVKDLSRFGRNYLEVGNYLEHRSCAYYGKIVDYGSARFHKKYLLKEGVLWKPQ